MPAPHALRPTARRRPARPCGGPVYSGPQLALHPGTRIGAYEIGGMLGEGGMGEVYRARDTILNRDVAMKVLPDSVARDLDRSSRFKREAESLAALNHPNIAQVYGFETAGDTRAIVMELVAGRPLSSLIDGRPMPLDEALAIARQVALALEGAHERGIVHRDLKPANVMVRDDGVVKVLDFGLAKALHIGPETAKASSDLAATVTSPAHTEIGLILGTAAYMAPEQARGKPVDRRADLWAFGCVVYEMLTGRSPFRAEDLQQTLANVLNAAPDFTALPAATPPSVRRLLHRCLVRERRERLADASTARLEIDDATREPSGTVAAQSAALVAWWRQPVPWPVAVAAAVVAIAAMSWFWPTASSSTPAVTRLDIALPFGEVLGVSPGAGGGPALAPDGRSVFYAARRGGISYVFRRRFDDANVELLPGTEGAVRAFVYPNGEWLGFTTTRPFTVKKLRLAGGPPTTVFAPKSEVHSVSFTAGGDVLFGDHAYGLFRVPAAGNTPELLLPLGESGPVRFPVALPGNRGLLLTVGGVPIGNRIAVLPAGQTTPRFLTNGTDARYLATGHIVFWRDGSLFASAFDLDRLELAGDAVPVIQQVAVRGNGAAMYDVAANGTLAYVKAEAPPAQTLVWVTRRGDEEPLKATAGPYAALQLSPDGQKVLLSYRSDASEDIWLHDITRQVTEPFVNEPASEWQSLWTADGERVLFTSRRAGPFHLFAKRANGLGAVEKIADDVSIILGRAPDGSALITAGDKLGLLTLADGSRRDLFGDDAVLDARVSPNGRWIAYRTAAPQGAQIMWIRPYPDVHTNRWRIATAGGPGPRWSPDGRTIFYRHGGDMMAVDLGSGAVPAPASPVRLFAGPSYQDFDVARDGRFLMLKEPASPPPHESRIIVVLNWFEELRARLSRR